MGVQPRVGNEGRTAQRIGRYRILRALESDGVRGRFLATAEDGAKAVVETFGASDEPAGDSLVAVPPEAAAYARLTHPGVVRALEAFVDEGRLAVALEPTEGTTLDVFRGALDRKQQRIGHASWVYVAACAFDALAAAHSARGADGRASPVIHRGIAPSSIQLAWSGDVKVGGFDLGNVAEAARESSRVQRAPSRYLAPEQSKLQPAGPQADVYSLTLVLWELLSKRKVSEIGARPIDAIDGEIETGVRAVIQAGLEPEVAKRTLGAARAAALLRAAIDVEGARRDLVDALSRTRIGGASLAPANFPSAPPSLAPTARLAPVAPAAPATAAPAAAAPAPLVTPPEASVLTPPPVPAAPAAPAPPAAPTARVLPEMSLAQTALVEMSLAQTSLAQIAPPNPPPPLLLKTPTAPEPEEPSSGRQAPDAGPRDAELDPWFQSMRPPTPGGFTSMFPGIPTEAPPPLSPEELDKLAQRRQAARKVLVGCMVGSLCIVFAALCVRGWAAVTAPRNAAITVNATPAASIRPSTDPAPATPHDVAPPPTASAPSDVPSPAAPPATVARVTAPIPRTMGELRLPSSAAGHRLFVDNRSAGDASSRVRVSCGRHTVRVGSSGRKLTVDVPCGGSVAISP